MPDTLVFTGKGADPVYWSAENSGFPDRGQAAVSLPSFDTGAIQRRPGPGILENHFKIFVIKIFRINDQCAIVFCDSYYFGKIISRNCKIAIAIIDFAQETGMFPIGYFVKRLI